MHSPFRLRYWPCIGLRPLVVALIVALPVAIWARRDSVTPSTIQCSPGFRGDGPHPQRVEPRCMVNDPHGVSWVSLPCSRASSALDGLLDSGGPFDRPVVTATLFGATPRASEATGEASDPVNGVDAATARRLLVACTDDERMAGDGPTVQVKVLDRDYEASALVLGAFALFALVAGLRRRARIDVDSTGLLVVVERGFVAERRTAVLPVDAIADVRVETGATGMLSGRRVELVRHDGSRVPLVATYAPLTTRVHERVARRLSDRLGAFTRTPVYR